MNINIGQVTLYMDSIFCNCLNKAHAIDGQKNKLQRIFYGYCCLILMEYRPIIVFDNIAHVLSTWVLDVKLLNSNRNEYLLIVIYELDGQ